MLNSSYFSYVNKIFSKGNSHLSLFGNCSGAIIFSGNSFLFAILNSRWAYSICLIQWPIHRRSIKKCKTINWQVKLGRKAFLTHPSAAAASNIKPPFSFHQSIKNKYRGITSTVFPRRLPLHYSMSVWKTGLLHLLRICFPSIFIWSFFSSFLLDKTYFTFHYQPFFKVYFLEQKTIWLTGKAVSFLLTPSI